MQRNVQKRFREDLTLITCTTAHSTPTISHLTNFTYKHNDTAKLDKIAKLIPYMKLPRC